MHLKTLVMQIFKDKNACLKLECHISYYANI